MRPSYIQHGSTFLYKHLLKGKSNPVARIRSSIAAINGVVRSVFGTSQRYESVEHHTILFGQRFGLLDDIFDNKVLGDDFALYLHRPTATDPSLPRKT